VAGKELKRREAPRRSVYRKEELSESYKMKKSHLDTESMKKVLNHRRN